MRDFAQPLAAKQVIVEGKPEMRSQPCVLCGKILRGPGGITNSGDPAVVIFMSGVTRGRRPRLKTRTEPIVFCNPCASSIALGVVPQDRGDLYVKAWRILRKIVEMDDQNAVVLSAITQLRFPRARLQRMPGSVKELSAASGYWMGKGFEWSREQAHYRAGFRRMLSVVNLQVCNRQTGQSSGKPRSGLLSEKLVPTRLQGTDPEIETFGLDHD